VGDDLPLFAAGFAASEISIHIPRVGDDKNSGDGWTRRRISIHIPRVGDDDLGTYHSANTPHFNPHPPCGG